jgi:purine-nucleoside phosphorylase
MKNKIEESTSYLKKIGIPRVKIGIVLGTGLHDLVSQIKILKQISYSDIPHFPIVTQKFQKGVIIYGTLEEKPIVIFQGRFHLYEGYNYFEITYLVRIFKSLGGSELILSNAAGAINLNFEKGQLMLLKDHINLQGGSPLAIKNLETLGERFVDMSNPYDSNLRLRTVDIAEKEGVILQQGVYASVIGPQLETAAEYRYLKIIGADAVGMSTVPEVIVARQLGIRVLAISVLTDKCDPDDLQPINIEEIMEMAKRGEKDLVKIVKGLVGGI